MEPIDWGNVWVGFLWLVVGAALWRSGLRFGAVVTWVVSFFLLSHLIAAVVLYTVFGVFT